MIDNAVICELEQLAGKENVLVGEPLSAYTTFKIGGPADCLLRPTTVEGIAQVMAACKKHGVPVHVLGRGSDLLVADAGVRGVVLQIADNLSGIEVDADAGLIVAEAGATNEAVAQAAAEAGLAGYEFASGIPGGIGGAAIMNAGAYDGQFSDVAVSVTCLDAQGAMVTVSADEADWGYRHSRMSDEGMIVLSATLALDHDAPSAIYARMADLSERRAAKQPLELPSAGSTFKRPEGYFAGKLIQDAGMQGASVGGAQVSTKHAGFVVNVGDATAQDVRDLIAAVQQRVYEDAGVRLEPEVRMWGFDD